MYTRLTMLLLLCAGTIVAQDNNKSSRFSISAHYGPAYNFFVDYGRPVNKDNGTFIPPVDVFGSFELIQKNKMGTIGGLQVGYAFNEKNTISLGYTRELHVGKFKGNVVLGNGTPIFVEDIKLRHLNEFFELNYKRVIGKSYKWYFIIGFYILNASQSEIAINPDLNFVEIRERNNANSNLQEGGFSIGSEYYFYKSGQFQLGLTSKLYFTASTGEFETLTFTPILQYNF